jgi:hypothetical protein
VESGRIGAPAGRTHPPRRGLVVDRRATRRRWAIALRLVPARVWYDPRALGRPDIGVGPNCLIRNAIIDKNARIGAGCRLAPTGLPEKWETDALFVRDGVIVVKKGAIVPPGTIVGE